MHSCLSVVEILRAILSHLSCSNREDHAALAAVAATCRSFSEPALDNLWHTLNDISKLIEVLPSDLWAIRQRSETDLHGHARAFHEVHAIRPFLDIDVERFHFYARRVRKATSSTSRMIHPSVYSALYQRQDSEPLLPGIRELQWCPQADEDYPSIKFFLSPTLTSLRITEYSRITNVLSATELGITHLCPDLDTLAISRIDPTNEMGKLTLGEATPMFTSLAKHFTRIRLLVLPVYAPVMWDAVLHLANLSALEVLNIKIASGIIVDLPTGAFVNLRTLIIRGDLIMLTPLIKSVTSGHLRKLNVTYTRCARNEQLKGFFAALDHCPYMESLEHVTVFGLHLGLTENVVVDHLVIGSLFRARSLKFLNLNRCMFDNEGIRLMAMSWPKIQILALDSPLQVARITLLGLLPLIESCPLLREIQFRVDASGPVTVDNVRPGGGYVNRAIEHLNIGGSLIGDTLDFATVVSDFLPNINYLNRTEEALDGETEEERCERILCCQDTVRMIENFAIVRDQERNWITGQQGSEQ